MRRMRAVSRIIIILCVLVAAGCTESDDLEVVTDAAGYTVGLVDPGEGERVSLRVTTEPGASEPIRMVLDQVQELSIGGQTQTVETTQTMDVTYTVREVDGELISVDTHYDAMTVDSPAIPAELRDAMVGAFVGQTATTVFTDRGAIVSIDFPDIELDVDVPGLPAEAFASMMDQLFSSLEENTDGLAVPTPVEPIGLGGSWTATTEATVAGIPMELEITNTVIEITSDTVVTETAQVITFVQGDADILGTTVTIEEGRMDATGTVTYARTGGILPLADIEMSGSTRMTGPGGTIEQSFTMHQTTSRR